MVPSSALTVLRWLVKIAVFLLESGLGIVEGVVPACVVVVVGVALLGFWLSGLDLFKVCRFGSLLNWLVLAVSKSLQPLPFDKQNRRRSAATLEGAPFLEFVEFPVCHAVGAPESMFGSLELVPCFDYAGHGVGVVYVLWGVGGFFDKVELVNVTSVLVVVPYVRLYDGNLLIMLKPVA